jgi:hypothetical protein
MRAYEKQKAWHDNQREEDRLWEAAYQLFMSRYKPGMSAWTNQPASLRQSYYDEVKAVEAQQNPGLLADDGDFDD